MNKMFLAETKNSCFSKAQNLLTSCSPKKQYQSFFARPKNDWEEKTRQMEIP
jgi:hypothetical protein